MYKLNIILRKTDKANIQGLTGTVTFVVELISSGDDVFIAAVTLCVSTA